MIFLSSDELGIFELLDPASARRLLIGRTGRAFVWDPIASTREVPLSAARALVAQGIVDSRGRIAAEHLGMWRRYGTSPSQSLRPQSAPQGKPAEAQSAASEAAAAENMFERTLPIGLSSEGLRTMG